MDNKKTVEVVKQPANTIQVVTLALVIGTLIIALVTAWRVVVISMNGGLGRNNMMQQGFQQPRRGGGLTPNRGLLKPGGQSGGTTQSQLEELNLQ